MNQLKLLRDFEPTEDELCRELEPACDQEGEWLPPEGQRYCINRIVTGRVRRVVGDRVWIDIGFKSDGAVTLAEWYDGQHRPAVPPQPGDAVEVLLEGLEGHDGAIPLSIRKARRRRAFEAFAGTHHPGDPVAGTVTRRVKGGLLVDLGTDAFLPASEVDLCRPSDLGAFLGLSIECLVVGIDRERQRVALSRRAFLQQRRERLRADLLSGLTVGQCRAGVVRNVVPFGAFVDLGGLDALLHVSQMSWDRVTDPWAVVRLGQRLEVSILRIDRAAGQVSVSLKHSASDPWLDAEARYPTGSRHVGAVVNVRPFGAFIRLGPGVEGLVHVSELSDGRPVPPAEAVAVGDRVEVQVLHVDVARRRIDLSRRGLDPVRVGRG